MDYNKLIEIADKGSVQLSINNQANDIVAVEFTVRGLPFKGQYDSGSDGIYAIRGASNDDSVIVTILETLRDALPDPETD